MPVEQLIYTDRPRGKGVDPGAAGYQIKACSAGLTPDLRGILASICMHYGDAVYRYAPRAALDRETAWRAKADSVAVVPDEVLDAFPEIWTYDRLTEDQFSLTRVRYSGFTHDGRTGNFFAHALVFNPGDLKTHSFNPLALSRLNLLRRSDASDETSLPTVSDLGVTAFEANGYGLLTETPYRERIAAMVSSLITATPSARPALLCLADWRKAAAVVEALLSLLPPTARSRTTFTTYESDRRWLIPKGRGARPTDQVAAHHLLVVCGSDGRTFDLRPDEYRLAFAIFNFVENQFSEAGAPGPYAAFAAACVTGGMVNRLKAHHDLVEALAFGRDPKAWDALVPAAGLREAQLRQDDLAKAVRCLATLATAPQQAATSLGLLLPHVERLARADNAEDLMALCSDLGTLADRAASDGGSRLAVSFAAELLGLVSTAFSEGRARMTAALLKVCGRARESNLLAVLKERLSGPKATPAVPSSGTDREQMVELLLDGLRLADRSPDVAPPLPRLLVATFLAARGAGRVPEVWKRIGDPVVKPCLGGQWDEGKAQLIQELLGFVSFDLCPDGNAWLNLRLLEGTKPQDSELRDMLKEIAKACSRCADAEKLGEDLVRIARERATEPQQFAELLGQMAEAAYGTAPGKRFFTAYREELKQDEQVRRKVRRNLAEEGAARVLCREVLDELLPWSEGTAHANNFQSWWDLALGNRPNILDTVCQEVAVLLREPREVEKRLPLAEALLSKLSKQQGGSTTGLGFVALCGEVAITLPLGPLSPRWDQILGSPPEGVKPEARARLQVLRFMRDVEQRAAKPTWSVAEFPWQDPAWGSAAALKATERSQVVAWCVGTFATTGVTTPQESEALVQLLAAAGETLPDRIADAAAQLLKGRDPVTCVQVAMAFAQRVLEGPARKGGEAQIVGAILQRCDKAVRELFGAHLQRRFGRRGPDYEKRVLDLCEVAGLPLPRSAAPPPPNAAPAERAERGARTAVGPVGPGGIADTLADKAKKTKSFLGRLFYGSEGAPPPQKGPKAKGK